MKKSIVLILLTLLTVGSGLGIWSTPVQAAPTYVFAGGGGGTALNPYIVMTDVDMSHVKDDLEAHYLQGADIDLSSYADGSGWKPIGNDSTKFTGSFDGNHYTISGLVIDSTENFVGLFGYVEGSILRNIRLEQVNVTGEMHVGGLIGSARSTKILDSSVSGGVTGTSHTGGLVGNLVGTGAIIQNSYAAVDVSGDSYIGGLLGNVDLYTDGIESSYASGNVNGNHLVGGLAGVSNGSIRNSYATGHVQGHAAYGLVGGLTAYLSGDLHESFQTGAVTGENLLIGSLVRRYVPSLGATIDDSFYNTTLNTWPAVHTGSPGSGYQGLSDEDMKKELRYGGY